MLNTSQSGDAGILNIYIYCDLYISFFSQRSERFITRIVRDEGISVTVIIRLYAKGRQGHVFIMTFLD